jgi:VanZ family protein
MSGRTSWRSAWLPVAFWLAVIVVLSSIPNLSPPDVGAPLSDKLAHLGEYGILGILLGRAGERRAGRSGFRTVVFGALTGLVVGTLDELYQRTTPGREVSALDTVADVIGASLGALVWVVVARRQASRRVPEGSP